MRDNSIPDTVSIIICIILMKLRCAKNILPSWCVQVLVGKFDMQNIRVYDYICHFVSLINKQIKPPKTFTMTDENYLKHDSADVFSFCAEAKGDNCKGKKHIWYALKTGSSL